MRKRFEKKKFSKMKWMESRYKSRSTFLLKQKKLKTKILKMFM